MLAMLGSFGEAGGRHVGAEAAVERRLSSAVEFELADGVSRLQIDAALPSNPSATSFPAVGLLDQPHTEPTFLDLLATVPHLLHCYFQHSWHNNKVYGIRHLRRVSKEAGRIALTAVETCSILVGHRSWLLLPMYPASQSLVRLMKTAQLQKLCLAMRTTTGPSSPSTAQQLFTCTADMKCLLAGMGAAVQSVKRLKLHVTHQYLEEDGHTSLFDINSDYPAEPFVTDKPGALSHVTNLLLDGLASLLPHLQHLTLTGDCIDVCLGAFGTHCPQLKSLKVEALTVPVDGLQYIDTLLPNLTFLTLIGPKDATVGLLQAYTDKLCWILRGCSKLQLLEFRFSQHTPYGNEVVISCSQAWDHLPANLHELQSSVRVSHLLTASNFLSRVQTLNLLYLPCTSLYLLLHAAPHLRMATITSLHTQHMVDLTWDLSKARKPGKLFRVLIENRLLNDFQLSCSRIQVVGSCNAIKNLIAGMPPLLDTTELLVTFHGEIQAGCLAQFSRMCPNLESFTLYTSAGISQPVVNANFLSPLVGCDFLVGLHLKCLDLEFTSGGLVSFFVSLPELHHLTCHACAGLDLQQVKAELLSMGRNVYIGLEMV